jgi:hypothetical protein
MKTNERGFVSLLTCILLSLLIIVVTLSLIGIEALQLRKSDDAEQALRAYYTSESGVEDAVAKILSGTITANTPCTADPTFDSAGQSQWTCEQVTFDGTPQGNLTAPDQAVTVDPGPGLNIGSMVIEWNTNAATAGYSIPGNPPQFPQCGAPTSCPGYTYSAPPLELTAIQYPGTFNVGNVCPVYNPPTCTVTVQNALFYPKGTAVAGTIDYATGLPAGFLNNGPVQANCGQQNRGFGASPTPWAAITGETAANYNCYALIQNLNAAGCAGPGTCSNFIFRLRSRYQASNYLIHFKASTDGSGPDMTNVPTGSATIDVTARAGSSYRRVISELQLNPSAASGLNYVMYSDTNICKNFDILANVPPASTSTCPGGFGPP